MATTEHSDLEQQIIKTAQQLFIEKGFVETSMSDIAATVGINRPTLHYYFRTKDKMFISFLHLQNPHSSFHLLNLIHFFNVLIKQFSFYHSAFSHP